ncbi:hypothetical protein GCM10027569_71970 [Flindersiella endophytica]
MAAGASELVEDVLSPERSRRQDTDSGADLSQDDVGDDASAVRGCRAEWEQGNVGSPWLPSWSPEDEAAEDRDLAEPRLGREESGHLNPAQLPQDEYRRYRGPDSASFL